MINKSIEERYKLINKIRFNPLFSNSQKVLDWLEEKGYIETDSEVDGYNFKIIYEYYIDDKYICETGIYNYDDVLEIILNKLSIKTLEKILKELEDN